MRSFLFCSALLVAVVSNAYAGDLKIGIIDARTVESKALVMKDIAKKLEAQNKKSQAMLSEKEKSLQKDAQEFEKKRTVLSATALQEKQETLQQKYVELQDAVRKETDVIERAKADSFAKFDEKAKEVVEKISKDKKMDLVLSSPALLFTNPDTIQDLTSDFLDELNSKIKTSDFDDYYKKYSSNKK